MRGSPSASVVSTDEICPHKVSKESLVYWFNLLYWIVIEIYKSLLDPCLYLSLCQFEDEVNMVKMWGHLAAGVDARSWCSMVHVK